MIKFKINDLLKIEIKETKKSFLSIIRQINNYNERCLTNDNFEFNNHDFMDKDHRYEIVAVWGFDEGTGNYLKIYDKEKPFNPLERGSGMEAPSHDLTNIDCKPTEVEYEKYMQLQHENEELKNIIVELNKKLYG